MPAAELFDFLDRLGIRVETVAHAPLFTVAQSKALRGEIEGAHTKNLFLEDKRGRFYLVVAPEEARLDLRRLHGVIGASGRVSFAGEADMRAHLGVEPGSVTPFSAMNDRDGAVTIVLDQGLMAGQRLNFHPLVNTMTSTIARDDLLAFLRATGHEPLIVALPRDEGREGSAPAGGGAHEAQSPEADKNCHSASATPS